jgi:hypothetical protein
VFKKKNIPSYRCPSALNTDLTNWNTGTASYAGNYSLTNGYGFFYLEGRLMRMGEISDGLSYTIAVGEAGLDSTPGDNFESSDGHQPQWIGSPQGNWVATMRHIHSHRVYVPNGYYAGFGSGHPGGLHVLAGDGAVHWVSSNIDHSTWVSLGTRRRWTASGTHVNTADPNYGQFARSAAANWKPSGANFVEVQGQWDK